MNSKPYTFDRVVRMLIGLAVLILLFLLVKRLSDVLLPFLIAWLLAYLMQPMVHFFQFKLRFKNRALSILTTLIVFFGSITGVIWTLTPIVTSEIQKLSQLTVSFSKNINVNSFLPLAWQHEIQHYLSHLNFQTILKDDTIMNGVKKLAPQLWDFVNGSLDFILGFSVVIIVFLYLIFILLDFEKISASMLGIIPPKFKKLTTEIILDLESGMNRYFRGQALIALIVGILFIIGFSIIGLPLAIIMGLLIGLLTMVPYLKAIALIPTLMLGLLQSFETGQSFGSILIGIAIVYIIIQLLEDLFLTPRIMGKVTGLNPAVILLSLSIWGSLMGMVGLIIALPVTTLIISYYKRFVLNENENNAESTDQEEIEIPKNVEM
ncbi:MAG: AI-2E family transporter [Paludibacter sp.]|nr:AI-2E family transporter [Paludibacter sp.]